MHAEVRTLSLHLPHYAVTAFGERIDRHATEPGFTAVLAYADNQPVGYAYSNTIEHGDRYWQRTSPAPTEKYTERPAMALKEIGVHPSWRKTGTARRIHDTSSPPARSRTSPGATRTSAKAGRPRPRRSSP